MKNFTKKFLLNQYTAIIGLVIVSTLFYNFSQSKSSGIADIEIIKKYTADGAMIIDVRTIHEFNSGNYKGSINIPLAELESKLPLKANKDMPVIVYCRTGNRSGKAKEILEKNGYTNVINGGGLVNMPQ